MDAAQIHNMFEIPTYKNVYSFHCCNCYMSCIRNTAFGYYAILQISIGELN